jgi:hypothetical protein
MLKFELFEDDNYSLLSRFRAEAIKQRDNYCENFFITEATIERVQFDNTSARCYCNKSLICKNFNSQVCFVMICLKNL